MMKKLTLLSAIITLSIQLSGQDMFPARQMTFDPEQQGFATWSPDSKSIVYQHTDMYSDTFGRNGLWKVSADGTGAIQIFSGLAEHAKWSPDGKYFVFDADTGKSIKLLYAYSNLARMVIPDSVQIKSGGLPCWSPDGTRIAFKEDSLFSLCAVDILSGHFTRIFREDGKVPLPACWTPDGKNILIALMDRQTRKSTIWLISQDGKEKKQITGYNENFYRHLALSPDGSLLVYAVLEGKYLGLWIMPFSGGKSLPLAVTKNSHNEGAVWSPDGKRIAFTSTRSGNFDIWIMDVDIEKINKELKQLK